MVIMDVETNALGRYIAEHRKRKGISQEELSKRSGVPRGTIAAIETGTVAEVMPSNLQRLARGLGLPYAVLDRLNRGLPADLDATDTAIASMIADAPDELKRRLWEVLSLPQDQQQAALAGLTALLAALRR